jgi:hypothetical protein
VTLQRADRETGEAVPPHLGKLRQCTRASARRNESRRSADSAKQSQFRRNRNQIDDIKEAPPAALTPGTHYHQPSLFWFRLRGHRQRQKNQPDLYFTCSLQEEQALPGHCGPSMPLFHHTARTSA